MSISGARVLQLVQDSSQAWGTVVPHNKISGGRGLGGKICEDSFSEA